MGEFCEICRLTNGRNRRKLNSTFRSGDGPVQFAFSFVITYLPLSPPVPEKRTIPNVAAEYFYARAERRVFCFKHISSYDRHCVPGTCFGRQNTAHGERDFSFASRTCAKNPFQNASLGKLRFPSEKMPPQRKLWGHAVLYGVQVSEIWIRTSPDRRSR